MNNQKDFKRLYLKYKNKYLSLKNFIDQKGGANYQNDTGHAPGIHGPPPLPPRASASPPVPPRDYIPSRASASPVARLPTNPNTTITNNYFDPFGNNLYPNLLAADIIPYRKKIYYDYYDTDNYDDYDDDDDYKPRRRSSKRKTSRRRSSKRKTSKRKTSKRKTSKRKTSKRKTSRRKNRR